MSTEPSRAIRRPRCVAGRARLADGCYLLSHLRHGWRHCVGGAADLGRRVSGQRRHQPQRQFGSVRRRRATEPDLHVCNAGARRTVGHWRGRRVRSAGRQHQRHADGAGGTIGDHAYRQITDSLTSVGDLCPMAPLKWSAGVHNFMRTCQTGEHGPIPGNWGGRSREYRRTD